VRKNFVDSVYYAHSIGKEYIFMYKEAEFAANKHSGREYSRLIGIEGKQR